jgi:hypothetical protein
LTLKFARTEKYLVTLSSLDISVRKIQPRHAWVEVCVLFQPPLRQFDFALVEGGRGSWKLWSMEVCNLPG